MKQASWTVTFQSETETSVQDPYMSYSMPQLECVHLLAPSLAEAVASAPKATAGWFMVSIVFDHWIGEAQSTPGLPKILPVPRGIPR